jgi:MFS family permease
MMAGEASMVVALADSFFFDVDPDAARSRILLFLLVSFTPFLVIAPIIGPVIDRVRGGRRFVVQLVALVRVVLQLLMMNYADQLALFPLVFVALILQKTYAVSKSALVPSMVRSERELVEANSKLGLISGLTGFVAVVPAALLQLLFGTPTTLAYGALIFVAAFIAATRLPREVVIVATSRAGKVPPLPVALMRGARVMTLLRCLVGFMLFHLAFWFRSQGVATVWFGVAVGLASLGTMIGNAIAPRARRTLREEHMLVAALVLPAGGGLIGAVLGGLWAGIAVVAVVNFASAIARLAFESIVQRDAPGVNRGQVFARFETRFQLAWVAAATVPVLLPIPGAIGFLLVGLVAIAGLLDYRAKMGRADVVPARH